MMMTHRDLRGRRRKELLNRGHKELAPNLISLFRSCTGNLVTLNAVQLFQYTSNPGKGEDQTKRTQEKKNTFDIQADRPREVTSSWPLQKTWPPAV